MAPRISAGLMVYRRRPSRPTEVLLGHYGGPFWANRDQGAWTVFKGGLHQAETPMEAAAREFEEETGWEVPPDPWLALPQVKTPHQVMNIWAVEADFDPAALRPGMFSMEWPPHSGRTREFPEIDRVRWFPVAQAQVKVAYSQKTLLDHLTRLLNQSLT